jgi:hypothetical protein
VEHHPAFDPSAPADLEEIARRNEDAVDCAQREKTVGGPLDEAHQDRGRRERARPQQHRQENQQAERRRPPERHNGGAGGVCPYGASSPTGARPVVAPLAVNCTTQSLCPQTGFGVAIPEAQYEPADESAHYTPILFPRTPNPRPFSTWPASQPGAAPLSRNRITPIFSFLPL